MHQPLSDLVTITDAAYQMRVAGLQRLAAEEARIRSALSRIDQIGRNSSNADADWFAIHAMGADILWQAWIVRQKTQLNIQLAQVLAQREAVMRDVRHAFGRAQVAQMLLDQDAKARRQARQKRLAESWPPAAS